VNLTLPDDSLVFTPSSSATTWIYLVVELPAAVLEYDRKLDPWLNSEFTRLYASGVPSILQDPLPPSLLVEVFGLISVYKESDVASPALALVAMKE